MIKGIMKAKGKSKDSAKASEKPKKKDKEDELNEQIELLKSENDQLKEKYKTITRKIVDSTDLSQYEYIDKDVEPDQIDVKDLLHMLQKIVLLATQINHEDNIASHVEALELRITELVDENSTFFKNKLKLQERLEFIMQERDVWKRNAETLKRMYAKLARDYDAHVKPQAPTYSTINTCIIGAYKSNVNSKYLNERTFISAVPHQFLENVRESNIVSLQLNKIDSTIAKDLAALEASKASSISSTSNSPLSFAPKTPSLSNLNAIPDKHKTSSPDSQLNDRGAFKPPFFDHHSPESLTDSPISARDSSQSKLFPSSVPYSSMLMSEDDANKSSSRPGTSVSSNRKKEVSFNKDIDVRIYKINKQNDKSRVSLVEHNSGQSNSIPPIEPSAAVVNDKVEPQMPTDANAGNAELQQTIANYSQLKDLLMKRGFMGDFEDLSLRRSESSLTESPRSASTDVRSTTASVELDGSNARKGGISSKKKYPGEVSVQYLEPTLKMVIIKELSREKLDGNDWRMFAKRIGMSENEIAEWVSLRLQYPMARVLSFWSSKPEATVRLLHRHLTAPCFSYSVLAKRIENFYDVL